MYHKHILLGITGGIAAYKSAELVRLLSKAGAQVRVVMTAGAQQFITPLTLQTLSGHRVYQSLLDEEAELAMSHIELARWADCIVIAPATANFIAKLAAGFADDLLTTLCLATHAPIAVAPAMNQQMWAHSATQANLNLLTSRGISLFGPASGLQACGDEGWGRLLEPQQLFDELANLLQPSLLQDKRVVITAGPTQEMIDPVRYLTNRSSGKMGYAIAEAARIAGAKVTLISGPTALLCHKAIQRIDVTSANEMLREVMKHIPNCDIFIAAAAVSDYSLKTISAQKIKKQQQTLQLELIRNPDILSAVGQLNPKPITIGFAAETENVLENAKQKLLHKKLDMIVANRVGKGMGFDCDENELLVITPHSTHTLTRAAKKRLGSQLVQIIARQFFNMD